MNLAQFTSDGKFLMLALDHRGSIKKIINPQNPDGVYKEEIIQLKSEIIEALQDQFSGILIDQEYGLPAYKSKGKSFLLPLEKTGFIEQNGERITELAYTAADLKNMGASGAKLLIYFNPDVSSAKTQLETAKKALEDCKTHELPLFLEIVTYSTPGVPLQIHPRGVHVFDSVSMFVKHNIMPDIFKLEYPGSEEGCKAISGILEGTPWILLTGGEKFELFKEHLTISVKSGAKGFLAGRALWQELPSLTGEEKLAFLAKTLPERFKIISDIVKD